MPLSASVPAYEGQALRCVFAVCMQGLLLLIVSFIQLPLPPEEAYSAGRGDSAAAAAAAAVAAASVAEAGREGDRGISAEGPRQRGRPGSLKAFEVSESENCAETSLLRSLLSAAVPPPLQLRVRQGHVRYAAAPSPQQQHSSTAAQ